jgi:hypothetical protein
VGVKVRKRNGSWYVLINYHGRRKAKKVGSREAAEKVKREIEARLALDDTGIFESKSRGETFKEYAERWVSSHAKLQCKPSTRASYDQILNVHLFPQFGLVALRNMTRDAVKS